jgi:hypothetical protein
LVEPFSTFRFAALLPAFFSFVMIDPVAAFPVNLTDRRIVRGPPLGGHLAQQFWRECVGYPTWLGVTEPPSS